MKNKKALKITLIVVASVLVLLIILTSVLAIVYDDEIDDLSTVTKVADGFYTMNCEYDYDLSALLEHGVSSEQELVDYILEQLCRGVISPSIDISSYACTTFNAYTVDGDALFARNFDYTNAPCMLVWTTPKDGYASVSMTNLEFCGYSDEYLPEGFFNKVMTLAAPYIPVDGMNEKGLCIGVLELENGPTNQNTDKVDLTTTTMIRLVLDRAASVDEAIELFRSYDMHDSVGYGYHYQISDASGNSVVLEYVNNEISLIYPEIGKSYISAANYS